MNREIKFRFWDIEEKTMVIVDFIDLCSGCMYIESSSYVMQYTGLNDKNGKEIYEGDTIKCVNHGKLNQFSVNSEDLKGVIEFYLGCFCIKYNENYATLAQWDDLCEVTGNIYEELI